MLKSNAENCIKREALFPGSSCFPLTPDMRTLEWVGKFPSSSEDQLNKIFEVIGTPEPQDYEFITDQAALQYLKSFPKEKKIDLRAKYPGTPEELVNLMEKMLQFDPNKRITIKVALADSYFDDIRDEEMEMDAEVNPNDL